MTDFHLAQANIVVARWRFDHPRMARFVSLVDGIDELARTSPGFVWRPDSDSIPIDLQRLGRDPWRDLFTISVWESVEAYWEFIYQGEHAEVMRSAAKHNWFDHTTSRQVMWWTPVGHRPTVEAGLARLDRLEENGPMPDAFTFRRRFPQPA